MMEQMNNVLIECDELQYEVQQPTPTKGRSGKSNDLAASSNPEIQVVEPGSVATHHHHPRVLLPGVHRGRDSRTSSDGAIAAAIMMYSPDIPSAEGKSAYDSKPHLANYYASIETEETVKCFISTALFLAVVVAIVLIAFLENPQM